LPLFGCPRNAMDAIEISMPQSALLHKNPHPPPEQ
jgi:hypothetical protein